MASPEKETDIGGAQQAFRSTLWTVVLKAKDLSSPDRRQALETLIQTYWKPIYFFVRRKGNDPDTSKDMVQGFFAALLEKNFLQYVERGKGKFRSFLLTALEHFMINEYERIRAEKRGGGRLSFSLDFSEAESQVSGRPGQGETPEKVFLQNWAHRVMAEALRELKRDYVEEGRDAEFEALRLHLTEGTHGAPSYAEIAGTLGLTEDDIRKRIYRAREGYRKAIYEVTRSYTDNEDDAQEELRDLFSAFE